MGALPFGFNLPYYLYIFLTDTMVGNRALCVIVLFSNVLNWGWMPYRWSSSL